MAFDDQATDFDSNGGFRTGIAAAFGQSQAVTLNEGESYSLSFSSLPEINLQGGNNYSIVRANYLEISWTQGTPATVIRAL